MTQGEILKAMWETWAMRTSSESELWLSTRNRRGGGAEQKTAKRQHNWVLGEGGRQVAG